MLGIRKKGHRVGIRCLRMIHSRHISFSIVNIIEVVTQKLLKFSYLQVISLRVRATAPLIRWLHSAIDRIRYLRSSLWFCREFRL